mgnify:CR=1 FL=1
MEKVKITLWPESKTFEANKGEKLMTALKSEGFHINSSCGGCASCSDCIVIVKTGENNLSPQEFAELKLLGNIFHITKERLSCQTQVLGDVTIDISRHKDKSDHKNYQAKKSGGVITKKKEQVVIERREKELKKEEEHKTWVDSQGSKGGFNRPKKFKVKK